MTDTTNRNRQPKGSPTGGEFAAEAGAEATATLNDQRRAGVWTHRTVEGDKVLDAARTRRAASDAKVSTEKRNHLRRVVATTAEVVSLVCHEATKITWTPSGSDEFPNLHSPEITCPHAEERGGNVWLFEGAHGLEHGALNDAIGCDAIAKDDMVDFGEDAGVLFRDHGDHGDHTFEIDLSSPPTYPFTPKVAGPVAEEQLREHRDQYAELGLRTATLMGATDDWNGGDMLEQMSEWAGRLKLPTPGDSGNRDTYRTVAREYGWDVDDE